MSGENRENTLFYSEIPKTINRAAVLMLSWKPLLDLFQVGLNNAIPVIWCIFSDTAVTKRQKSKWGFIFEVDVNQKDLKYFYIFECMTVKFHLILSI